MLIRSQDKKLLSQLSNIEIVERHKRTKYGEKVATGYAVYLIGESNTELFIGVYSTEEKAIKVLDMICEEYQHNERCRARCEEDGTIPLYVFQMPQDSEVEE